MTTASRGAAPLFAALLLWCAPAWAQAASPAPAAAGTSAPAATVDPAITARAKAWLHRLQTGDVDAAARQELDSKMNALLTPTMVKAVSAKLSPLGDPVSFTYVGMQPVEDNIAYVYRVRFKTLAIPEVFVLDKEGKVSGIQFPPGQ